MHLLYSKPKPTRALYCIELKYATLLTSLQLNKETKMIISENWTGSED